MLVVECIDATNVSVLSVGAQYYAFPVNNSFAYISKFPNENAHTGCYSLSRFAEVPQLRKQVEAYEYMYEIAATKKKFIVYGFEASHNLVAIYKDKALEQYIGCVSKERCSVHQTLGLVDWKEDLIIFPSSLRLGDFEAVQEFSIVPAPVEIMNEQLCLF
ncbi:hypothetical protein [Solibacillus daqui]|uniref:hypothetical protein n=1 Tax=Solibacillus daqui TaxID=2912187 RepID=UPI0023659E6D|nr:hypothetical protein [Solibacillus daqui]